MITRLGWADGNRKTLQWVTDGMKLAPIGPTLVSERNAILAAVQASGTPADLADFWSGFAARGLGFSAQVISASPANVVDGFDLPQLGSGGGAEVTSGNNLIEPNECNTLNIPLNNNSAEAATGITAVLSSNTPGVTISQPNSAYPDIPAGGTGVMNTTPYQVSTADTLACFTTSAYADSNVLWRRRSRASSVRFRSVNRAIPMLPLGNRYRSGDPNNRTLVQVRGLTIHRRPRFRFRAAGPHHLWHSGYLAQYRCERHASGQRHLADDFHQHGLAAYYRTSRARIFRSGMTTL